MKITQLWRYPVKSLAGESLTSVHVEQGGIPFDRRYAVIDRSEKLNGKKFTARRDAALLSFAARVTPRQEVFVHTPAGTDCLVDDPSFQAELQAAVSQPLSLTRADGGHFHDAHNVLVVSAASLRALAAEWDAPVSPLRFRPNIVIDGDDLEPFAETQWVGQSFNAGAATLEVAALCERCVITTIDPETLVRSPDFLSLIVKNHAGNFGLYCNVKKPGEMRVADAWTICR